MRETAKITAICSPKGGKTVTTVNLGIGLAREGKKVLLVDVAPQGSLTASLGLLQWISIGELYSLAIPPWLGRGNWAVSG